MTDPTKGPDEGDPTEASRHASDGATDESSAQGTPAAAEGSEDAPEHHHHTLREEIDIVEDQVRVTSYKWGSTIMMVILAVILIGIAIAGWFWLT